MTIVLRQNATCTAYAPMLALDRRRRRLSSVVKKHAATKLPYIVSVHRKGDLLKPEDHTVRLRKTWAHTLVGPNDIVIITRIPPKPILGGGGGSDAKQIGAAVAMIALVLVAAAVAGPLAAAIPGVSALGTAGTAAIQAGIAVGQSHIIIRSFT